MVSDCQHLNMVAPFSIQYRERKIPYAYAPYVRLHFDRISKWRFTHEFEGAFKLFQIESAKARASGLIICH